MHAASPHRAREPGLIGHLALLLAMAAIAMQCFVLQPHVHAVSPVHEAGLSAHQQHDADGVAACSICRLGAAARMFTAPPDVATPAAPVFVRALAQVVTIQSARIAQTPPWRSRAPPLSQR